MYATALPCPAGKKLEDCFLVRAGTNPPKASKTFTSRFGFFRPPQNPPVRASNRLPGRKPRFLQKNLGLALRRIALARDAPCWGCLALSLAALVSINGGILRIEVPLFAPSKPLAATFLSRPSARLQSTLSRQGLIDLNARRFPQSRRRIVPYPSPARCYLSFQQRKMLRC